MKDFDINFESYDEDLFVMDSVESTSALLYKAVHGNFSQKKILKFCMKT